MKQKYVVMFFNADRWSTLRLSVVRIPFKIANQWISYYFFEDSEISEKLKSISLETVYILA